MGGSFGIASMFPFIPPRRPAVPGHVARAPWIPVTAIGKHTLFSLKMSASRRLSVARPCIGEGRRKGTLANSLKAGERAWLKTQAVCTKLRLERAVLVRRAGGPLPAEPLVEGGGA